MRCKILAAVAVLCLAAPLSSAGASLDYRAIAERIARQMALQPGERVLLVVSSGEFEELLPHLRYAVMEAGGVDLGAREVLVAPEGSDQDVLARGQAASLDALTAMFRDVDLAVLLPGAAPWNPEYAAMSAILREGRGRTIHFHWRGQDPFRSAIAVAGHGAILEVVCFPTGVAQPAFHVNRSVGERVECVASVFDIARVGDAL